MRAAHFLGRIRRWLSRQALGVDHRGWIGRTPLFDAAESGRYGEARRLLEKGADPNARRVNGDQPLHWAADGEMVGILLTAGADLEGTDHTAGTPLQWAARWNRVAAMRALLDAGASAVGRRKSGQTPLHEAKSRAAVDLLLRHGVGIDARDESGRSPLWHAVWQVEEQARRETVEALLERGADPLLRDHAGVSPLHLSRTRGDPWVRERLESAIEAAGRSVVPVVTPEEASQAPQRLLRLADSGVAVTLTEHPAVVQWELAETPRIARVTPGGYERIDDVALGPDRIIALAFSDRSPEIRTWDSPAGGRAVELPDAQTATAVDISPDGRWLAIGTRDEEILLADLPTGRVTCRVGGGEWTGSVRFSADGRYLASACSFQGGAHVRLDALAGGMLRPIAELDRSDYRTGPADFVDTLGALSFSADGGALLAWETSRITWKHKPRGWRGNLVCFEVPSGRLRWVTPIDGKLTGDPRSLGDSGHEIGYQATFAFDGSGRFVALGVADQLLLLDPATGACRRQLRLDHEILGLGHDGARGRWVLATDGAGLVTLAEDVRL